MAAAARRCLRRVSSAGRPTFTNIICFGRLRNENRKAARQYKIANVGVPMALLDLCLHLRFEDPVFHPTGRSGLRGGHHTHH